MELSVNPFWGVWSGEQGEERIDQLKKHIAELEEEKSTISQEKNSLQIQLERLEGAKTGGRRMGLN